MRSPFTHLVCLSLATGSKFFCGPPFSGGVILPAMNVREIETHLGGTYNSGSNCNTQNNNTEKASETITTTDSIASGSLASNVCVVPAGLREYLTSYQVSSRMTELRRFLSAESINTNNAHSSNSTEKRSETMNIGLYLRWCVCLPLMEQYHRIDPQLVREYIERWLSNIHSELSVHRNSLVVVSNGSSCSVNSIINVALRTHSTAPNSSRYLSFDECKTFHKLLTQPLTPTPAVLTEITANMTDVMSTNQVSQALAAKVMIGQPVKLASAARNAEAISAVVRIALGVDMILSYRRGDEFTVTNADSIMVRKMHLLAKYWEVLTAPADKQNNLIVSAAATTVPDSVTVRMNEINWQLQVSSQSVAENSSCICSKHNNTLTQAETIASVLQLTYNSTSEMPVPEVSMWYDLDKIAQNVMELQQDFDHAINHTTADSQYNIKHCFAIKSCPLTYILHYVIHTLHCGLECASICEIKQALKVHCSAQYIIYDSPCKTKSDILFVLQHHITINANSYHELSKIKAAVEWLKERGVETKSVIGELFLVVQCFDSLLSLQYVCIFHHHVRSAGEPDGGRGPDQQPEHRNGQQQVRCATLLQGGGHRGGRGGKR